MFSTENTMFSESLKIEDKTEIVFVSDWFSSDIIGGAELTTDNIIDASPFNVQRLHAKDVTVKLLEQGLNKFWIFGNFSMLNGNLIPTIVANLKYSVVEYDYKFCKYRSIEKHKHAESKECDCNNEMSGKMVSAFYHGAKSLWWMSEKQLDVYLERFPFLSESKNTVLSSVFDDQFFAYVKLLRENKKEDNGKWAIIGSNSWIKGIADSVAYCDDNSLEYEILSGLPHGELLKKLSEFKGLVFQPKGGDTCPRIVLEAKLLGLELALNENVQHKDELWFDTDDLIDVESYLYMARDRFWKGIRHDMNYVPEISGYTTTYNCLTQDYPFKSSIKSMLQFCSEVVVVDGGSTDGTFEELEKLQNEDNRIIIKKIERDWNDSRFAVFDGLQKAEARALCTKSFCWQQDSDEIVHENDVDKIASVVKGFPAGIELIALPVIEYWGDSGKVRLDVTPWKWRLSRNSAHITHGIPKHLREHDENGKLYAKEGTDGCDYIHKETGEIINFVTFYTNEADVVRRKALLENDKQALEAYENWFEKVVANIPPIHHYSWYNLERKIKLYKNYWTKHWNSLFNKAIEDTPENNMFFDKAWSDVTDEEISELAKDLESKLGGWIFHRRVNLNANVPSMKLSVTHPELAFKE